MSRELLIEKISREFCRMRGKRPDDVSKLSGLATWQFYSDDARAILALLSDPANITPEMAVAAANHCGKNDPVTTDEWRDCIAAAFSERAP